MYVVLRLGVVILFAFLIGKVVSKCKLPAILGWLVAGMVLGPHALSVLNMEVLDAKWYEVLLNILECTVGLMIGTELVWNKIKKSGKAIVITTLTQSLGTFFIVSIVFGIIFYFIEIPMYVGFIFGGIALATAPAPALSIVREFKTHGPVTKALIPMAALDDIVGCIVFFTTIAMVAGSFSEGGLPIYMIALFVVLPLMIGIVCGAIASFFLKNKTTDMKTLWTVIINILFTAVVGLFFNHYVLATPVLNFMLIGMAFSATFSNIISEDRLEHIMHVFNPFLGIALIIVIVNLGAPLDYHLMLGAGLFTVVYIVARAFGKYFGAYFGAMITHSPQTVKKYLGFTLLPHSGVSLVFTGIAVSILQDPAPAYAKIIQGTIAAAAVINEIIAVIMAKKGFEWAGECNAKQIEEQINQKSQPIIVISRQYGSGGRDIALQLSKQLHIPCYDKEIIALSAKKSLIDPAFYEHYEATKVHPLITDLAKSVKHTMTMDDRIYAENAKVIQMLANKGSCIFIGRCADAVLRQRDHVIKVFLYGDLAAREKRVIDIYHVSADEALEKIMKTDKERSTYYEHYANRYFGNPENYDICLNANVLGIEQCVSIIQSIYQKNEKSIT